MKTNRVSNLNCVPSARIIALLALGVGLSAPAPLAADSYAKAVVFARVLNGNAGNSHTDLTAVLGAPDDTYLSLGGPGASLIVDMGADTPV